MVGWTTLCTARLYNGTIRFPTAPDEVLDIEPVTLLCADPTEFERLGFVVASVDTGSAGIESAGGACEAGASFSASSTGFSYDCR